MLNYKPITLVTIFILIIASTGVSQEFLINAGNYKLKQYSKEYHDKNKNFLKIKTTPDTLSLPFFDDFSSAYIYPDSTKWMNRHAYINTNYAINPISIGNATMDALNEFGSIHPHLQYDFQVGADTLTSKPIDLRYNPNDAVFLNFYYQAGGRGDTPEERDSLVLQFRTPYTDWVSVWNVPGGENMDYFQQVLIPIDDSVWLKKGFQFQFINYVSLSSLYEPSWISNVDHWHLDYIWLKSGIDINSNDTLPNDVALVEPAKSMLLGYESIPWKHFLALNHEEIEMIADSINYVYKNYYKEYDAVNVDRRYIITDLIADSVIYETDGTDNENIYPLEKVHYPKLINMNFDQLHDRDTGRFEVKVYISPEVDDEPKFRWNDTTRYYQNFYSYYAYDDGTAEKGYGLAGQGSAYSKLALRFDPIKADTLRGVYMFFNHTLHEHSQNYFFLTVWDDKDSQPGDTIFQQDGVRPKFSNEINGFTYYELDSAIYIDGPFYIGWVKTTDDILNIGFDVNRKSNHHLFFNVSGHWQQSQLEGAIMVRPVFGDKIHEHTTNIEEQLTKQNRAKFNIYPNPANSVINIDTNIDIDEIQIFDINGRLVMSKKYKNQINISELNGGIYFIKPKTQNYVFRPERLIITR